MQSLLSIGVVSAIQGRLGSVDQTGRQQSRQGGSVASDTNGREERLAQALRANLHRRKAQSRARRQGDGAASADTALKNTERAGLIVDKSIDKVNPAVGSAGGNLDHG